MTYKFWDKDKTLRMLEDGLTPSELGKHYGVHHKTAQLYLKKLESENPDIKHKKVGRSNISMEKYFNI